jgi:tetratricopeptide (TPR) repeat protein
MQLLSKQKPAFIILVSLIMLFPAVCLADADSVFIENRNSVVAVLVFNEKGYQISQGSGFIVRADGAIVTNYHVIRNAEEIRVIAGFRLKEMVKQIEGLLYTDKENGLAIIKAKEKNLPVVRLGDIEKANIGETIYVISSTKDLKQRISEGTISGTREITPERKALQITAPVSPLSIGSPVFNRKGEVLGIITFVKEGAENISLAMPVNLVKDKINIKKITSLQDDVITEYYWFYLGDTYAGLGMYEQAIISYKQAIKINLDIPSASENLGVAYLKLGIQKQAEESYRQAITSYRQAIKIKPDYVEAYYNLGAVYSNTGEYEDAILSYKKALKIKPDYTAALDKLVIAYLEAAERSRAEKSFKQAITYYRQAIKINPDYAEAHYNLGVIYSNSDKYNEAIKSFKQALKINPDYIKAHYDLSVAYVKLGMREQDAGSYKQAITSYRQALKINPDYAKAHYNLGVIYRALGKNKEAITSYKQAIKTNPDYAAAHSGLGYIYMGLHEYQQAVMSFRKAVRINPDDENTHYNLGVVYSRSGVYEEAINSYRQAVKIRPDFAAARYGLGYVYVILRRKDLAMEEYNILKKHNDEIADKLLKMINR